jgi:hypothetical protein
MSVFDTPLFLNQLPLCFFVRQSAENDPNSEPNFTYENANSQMLTPERCSLFPEIDHREASLFALLPSVVSVLHARH